MLCFSLLSLKKKHLKISLDSKIDDKILRILPDITAH